MSRTCDSPLQAALDRLTIPDLWHRLDLRGKPGRSCRSPFREDRNPSFSVYDDGRKWKDHGKAHGSDDGGDAVDFLARALNLSNEDACRKLIELAGVIPHIPHFPREEKHADGAEEKAKKRRQWPLFEAPAGAEIKVIAELRGLSIEGVSLAADRGLLRCANSREGQAWIITDSRRVNAQARRLDGQTWTHIGGKKAWTLPGSEAKWPVGLREASSFPAIALVEGSADLIAAFHLAWCAGVEGQVAPVAILGASNALPEDTFPYFAGKRVRIFPHGDEAGIYAGARWAAQLLAAGVDVDGYSFTGLPRADAGAVKDLNDFAHVHPDQWEESAGSHRGSLLLRAGRAATGF